MLSKEAERAIRFIARAGDPMENSKEVESAVAEDCLELLMSHGYVRDIWDDPERELYQYQECNGYELTIKGRNYFSNKRRIWLRSNSGALIAAAASIAAGAVGYLLGHYLP